MSVPLAYLGLILIWSTTPLAIKWSNGAGYLYAVSARMVLGAVSAMLIALLLRRPLAGDRRSLQVYLTSGLAIYLSMGGIYWSAQHIPSGWISVIFGLSPLMTGVLATLVLNERGLTPVKILGMVLGLLGLSRVFSSSLELSPDAMMGVLVSLFAVFAHAAGAVAIKRLGSRANGLATSIGGMLVAIPCFLLTGLILRADWQPELDSRTGAAILYLGVIGCTLGFTLYYFVLRHVTATRVSLITMITPLCALLLGSWLNDEPLVPEVWLGSALIAAGLLSFEFDAGRALWRQWRLHPRGDDQ